MSMQALAGWARAERASCHPRAIDQLHVRCVEVSGDCLTCTGYGTHSPARHVAVEITREAITVTNQLITVRHELLTLS
jgi:hypothetical protein